VVSGEVRSSMTLCRWCGMQSDDDTVCSWCSRPLPAPAIPASVSFPAPSAPAPRRRISPWPWIAISFVLISLVAVLAFKMGADRQRPVAQSIPASRLADNRPQAQPAAPVATQPTYQTLPPPIQYQNDQPPPIQIHAPPATQPSSGDLPDAKASDASDLQKEQDKADLAKKVAAIREAAKAYNDMLANFESFPAEYQMTADREMSMVMGAAANGVQGRVQMTRTNAMQRKLHEISDQLNSLFKKVLDDKIGQELFQRGPFATARNANVRREFTNAFDEAAKIVESFPYLLARQ